MKSRWYLRFPVVLAICVLGTTSSAQAQVAVQGEAGWVGLYDAVLLNWLENENRLKALCPYTDTSRWQYCRDEKMKPKQQLIQLRSGPHKNAASEGVLVIKATPAQGLRAYYRSASSGRETEFVPDLFDPDWGYGPYFHQTFLERRGTWFLLPAAPLPRPAWINLSEPHVRLVHELAETHGIVKTPGGDIVVLDMNRRVLRARPEQDADMWCKDESPPLLKPFTEISIPVEKLYSSSGHLLVDIKYKRGC